MSPFPKAEVPLPFRRQSSQSPISRDFPPDRLDPARDKTAYACTPSRERASAYTGRSLTSVAEFTASVQLRLAQLAELFCHAGVSGKTKISTFQLYRLKTSRQLWLAQNVTAPEPLSTLCCSVFSRDHAFIPEFPQFHRHSPVSHYRKPSSENSSPA
uniref:Uncharacterized protein n=1 Tax=Rangifer tarandus platyrhynchus TaxID=3082113 RepID=A0ACB0ELF9_RANTA|nr:unnamed protein product [Rangifer tarandus platyrhynchus]